MTTFLICQSCRAPVPVAYDTAVTAVLCTNCQPKPTRLQSAVLCVLAAIHPYRARLMVTAVWTALVLVVVVSWVGVMVLR